MMKSLDILIGVSAVMLAVSMLVTVITHIITTLLNTRGGHLRRGLGDILKQIDPVLSDEIAKQISNAALRHPLVNDVTWRLGTVVPPGNSEQPRGSKAFFQMNRKGRWACGPCLNLVNQIRCDAHVRAHSSD